MNSDDSQFGCSSNEPGWASVNKAIDGDVGYVACSGSSAILALLKEQLDPEPRSMPRVRESEASGYEGRKVRSRRRVAYLCT